MVFHNEVLEVLSMKRERRAFTLIELLVVIAIICSRTISGWNSMVRYINAGWTGIDPDAPPIENLVPWPAHPYHSRQVYVPQPA
jgi:prepilin-type N-terminal cleavage/methylation domain-containing protein